LRAQHERAAPVCTENFSVCPLDLRHALAQQDAMETPDDEPAFLRGLIKTSRQRPAQVTWTDRDGSPRHTALTLPEAARLNAIARRLKTSPGEVLRQAAHIPVAKAAVTKPGADAPAEAGR